MDGITDLIFTHLSLYPGMELADCLKLLYQSELGIGHLVGDEVLFATRIRQELAGPLLGAAPAAAEDIGNGRRRVPLSTLSDGPSVETFTRLAARSARLFPGSRALLAEKLLQLRGLAGEGALPYNAATATAEIDAYIAADMPPQHHSGRFVAQYHPHYRVLDAASALFLPVFRAIDKAAGQKPHVLVGIDGMSAAGKSTLADMLVDVYGCGVVRTDDFFLPSALRSRERLLQPGGNIDYERLAPVAAQARHRFPFAYTAYDCGTDTMQDEVHLPGGPLAVLEGAYALHPKVAAPCDVRVFLSVSAEVQRARILRREGPDAAARFFAEWIPMEHRYFSEYGIREGCDVILDTSSLPLVEE